MKFYYVYVIISEVNSSRYIGFTSDIGNRIKYHNAGKSKYTKNYIPWKIVYFESYDDETKARKREIQLKKSSWHKKQLFDRIFSD